jgi:peptidyl-prolyl cis-trans isomerase D
MNLKENILDSMIDERILLTDAKETGIHISDEELQESITHEPAFMRNGVFDNNIYINRLRLNRVTPEEYENSKRQELTLKKIRRLIQLSVDSSDIGFNKEKALKSYVEAIKKHIKIKINKQLIS